MEDHTETDYQETRDLLTGLIQQQHTLDELGTSLLILLLCAGVQPSFKTEQDSKFHPAPAWMQ
ncbi:MAG TPA: hypothetical protein ENJ35_04425 [Gammaproteobacteria bacterium]|nr:hypothetical protein [Gammaproteobacteria bacterium]